MRCTVNGQSWPEETLACQERHFGQAAVELRLLDYEVQLAADEFVAHFATDYQDQVGWEREDEPFYRPGKDILIDRWHALSYPPLAELMKKDPEVLTDLIRWRMGHAMLRKLFPLVRDKVRFVLNTLDRIEVLPERITLGGKAWEA